MASRLIYHCKGLFFDYKRATTHYKNQYDDNNDWRCDENWFVFIQLRPHFWHYDDLYYDGHTQKRVTLLGISVGYGYSWVARRLADWKDDL